MTEGIYLRILEPSDLERVYQWHNDQALYRTLMGTHHFVSRGTVETWLHQKSTFSNSEVNLAICLKEKDTHIGNIYLRDIDWTSRHGLLHLFIGEPSQRGKGYGQQAVNLLLEYAFITMGLKRIYLYVFEENQAALAIYKKAGFKIEGTLRQHVFKEGRYADILIMGLCANEYQCDKE